MTEHEEARRAAMQGTRSSVISGISVSITITALGIGKRGTNNGNHCIGGKVTIATKGHGIGPSCLSVCEAGGIIRFGTINARINISCTTCREGRQRVHAHKGQHYHHRRRLR